MSPRTATYENAVIEPSVTMAQAYAERGETQGADLVRLAETLAEPQDLDALPRDFEAGSTWLRDASGYSKNDRAEVLAGRTAHSDELARASTNVLTGVLHDEGISGQVGAWNFLVSSSGIIRSNYQNPWARDFNELFSVTGRDGRKQHGLGAVTQALADHDDKNAIALRMLDGLSADPERNIAIGRFLAGRSQAAENFHRRQYGAALEQAKADDAHTFLQLARESGLAPQHINRTLRQIQLVDHAAFDHLIYGGTASDSGSRADYLSGTLRIAVKYGGSPARPHFYPTEQVIHDVRHETFHAASAQAETRDGQRIGLETKNGGGHEITEALAEYQTQIGSGFSDFRSYGDGRVSYTGTYQDRVLALHALRVRDPSMFHVLFNANYGQAQPRLLERALHSYYGVLEGMRR
jgi:hypothetical protein